MKLSTLLIIAGMIIISLYLLVEVSYYASSPGQVDNRTTSPYLEIPVIDIDQGINNKSIDYGIYHEPESAKPGVGTVVLFGHRTFHGSPFLNLDKLKTGDTILISWPGIGNVEYKVTKSYVVPASYRLSVEQGKKLFLITCYPLGSSKERLIIQADQSNIYPFNYNAASSAPQNEKLYSILFILSFLGFGLFLTYFYPVKSDKIILFTATIALTVFLIYAFIFPIPPNNITEQLSNINNWFDI